MTVAYLNNATYFLVKTRYGFSWQAGANMQYVRDIGFGHASLTDNANTAGNWLSQEAAQEWMAVKGAEVQEHDSWDDHR